jgi:hypothetical protein
MFATRGDAVFKYDRVVFAWLSALYIGRTHPDITFVVFATQTDSVNDNAHTVLAIWNGTHGW